MKKSVVLAAGVLAASIGAYWYSQPRIEGEALEYIPADTALFSAQLRPFPLKEYLSAMSSSGVMNDVGYQLEVLGEVQAETTDSASRFVLYLYQAYLKGLAQPDTLIQRFGLPDRIRSYFYTVGAVPVLRWEVANADAFWTVVDEAEKDSGWSHRSASIAGQSYRAYPLTKENAEHSVELVIAERDGMMTISILSSLFEQTAIEQALGITPSANPISASPILADIITTHGFLEESVGFINHQALARAVVSEDNLLGQHFARLFGNMGDDPFANFRTPECQRELNDVASAWPRTVVGLTSMTVDSSQASIDMKMAIEAQDGPVLAALHQLRGFLPSYLHDDDAVLTAGLGLNVSELAPSLGKVWKAMTSQELLCRPLADVQQELRDTGSGLVALGGITGMAGIMRGAGFSVMDYEFDTAGSGPVFKRFEALLSLSSNDPALLFDMVQRFLPNMSQAELKGGELDLSALLPAELGIPLTMAFRNQHIVFYTGEKAKSLADGLNSETLKANGLLEVSMNYGKVVGLFFKAVEVSGESVPEALRGLVDAKVKMDLNLDVSPKGPVIESGFKTRP